ncbi:MAG: FG-GAP-like repeat-containing protein [Fuerstiella sp.]
MNNKQQHFKEIAWLLFLASSLLGCSHQPPSSPQDAEATESGHEKMREELARIADSADRENIFTGEVIVNELRGLMSLPSYTQRLEPDRKWKFFLDLGVKELRLGNETEAIAHLTQALATVPTTSDPDKVKTLTHYHLALAYLRLAETQNCCQRNTQDSCIVPIQGSGIHQNPTGARHAIDHLKEVLSSTTNAVAESERLETHESARWLLNIACMILGEYPDAVPEEFRIPVEFFKSTVDFPKFRNVYPELGLDTFNLCGGVVIDDLDGDLDLDIITCTWDVKGQTKVIRNNADGTFTDVTEESGLTGFYGGLHLNQADFDNDGDLDIFIVRGAWLRKFGLHPNSLLRNDGNLKFTDVTFELGLAEPFAPSKTAAWADFDNDGDLDLYVGNESSTLGLRMGSDTTEELIAPCQLFRNDGADGFTEVASQAGIDDIDFSMGAVWGDYNNDRYPDLFLSQIGDNRLYRNNRDGTFTDVAAEAGVLDPPSSFATWFFDFDNDGLTDIFVGCNSGPVGVLNTNIRFHLMKLYRNMGDGKFQDVAAEKKLDYPAEPMGANFGDLDNDGFLDFYLATGNVAFSEIRPNVMFRNNAGQSFTNVTMAGGFGHLQKGHAVSFADIDNDGDQDVYVQLGGAYAGDKFSDALFANPGFGNNFITLNLKGIISNRCAIGAKIAITVSEDGKPRTIRKEVTSGSSFGANPLRQTIGLGTASNIQRVEVYWPTSDTKQAFTRIAANRAYEITEGKDSLTSLKPLQFALPE